MSDDVLVFSYSFSSKSAFEYDDYDDSMTRVNWTYFFVAFPGRLFTRCQHCVRTSKASVDLLVCLLIFIPQLPKGERSKMEASDLSQGT